ncbi:Ig-like domain-containing protein, partial [Variovorax sp. LARHSF232]
MFKSTPSKRKSTAGARRAPSVQASKRHAQLQALEPRVLLDAAAAATAEHVVEQAHQAAPEQQPADADVGAALAQVDQMAAPATQDPAVGATRLGASPSLLAASGLAPTVSPGHSLLVDGSFEADGWTAEKGLPEHGKASSYGVGPIEGAQVVEVEGAVGSSYIQQTVSNLVPGQTYTLSWYAHTRTVGSTGNDLGRTTVIGAAGGDVVYDYETSRTDWQRYTVTFTASETGSATIRFASRGNTDGGGAKSGSGLILDAARLDVDSYVTHYSENEVGVAVVAPDTLITDLDSANLQSLTVKIGNGQAGDVLALGATLPAGIAASYDADTFTLTLSGLATRDAYLAALKAVQFSSTSDALSTVDRNIVISANDGVNASSPATTVMKITAVNDAPLPVQVDDVPGLTFDAATGEYTMTAQEDASFAGRIAASDADGDLVSFSAGTRPASGTLVVNADGSYSYTPASDFAGTDSFTLLADDGHGGVTTIKVNVVVAQVNDAPVAKDVAFDIPEDVQITLDLLVNDSDVEDGKPVIDSINGTALTGGVQTIDVPGGQVLVGIGGTLTFVPALNVNGTFTFDYTVRDSAGAVSGAKVTVSVGSAADSPLPAAPPISVPGQTFDMATGEYTATAPEDAPLAGQVFAADPDSDPVSFSAGTRPANGTLVVNADGTYSYTPADNFAGTDIFTILADDGQGGVTPITVNVVVNAVNDAPIAKGVSFDVLEDTRGTIDLLANDSDVEDGKPSLASINGTALTGGEQIIDVPGGQVFIGIDGKIDFLPAADVNGAVSFDYTVTDSLGALASATVTINVIPVNDAARVVDPGIAGQVFDAATATVTVTVAEDTPVDGRIAVLDPEGDLLNFTVDTPPAHGTVVINLDGTYTYVPDADYNGQDSFVIMVDDGQGNLTPATVIVEIGATQDAPRLVDPQIPGQSFDPATGITTVTANEGQPVDGAFGVVDPDGDALAITVDTPPAHGALVINPDGTYTYTPEPGFSGEDSFVVIADDGNGNLTPIVIALNVLPEAPQLVDPQLPGQSFDAVTGTITVNAIEDLPVEGRIDALDLQGDLLNFTVDTPPAHGTVVINLDGSYTYTPDPDFSGEDSFIVMVDDGKGNLTPATVVVAIGATEDAPHLVDPQIPGQSFDPATGITTVTANEGQPVDGAFGVVDPDGDALAITVDTPPAHGALVINPDGTYSYTPEPGFSGEDSFVVIADDGNGNLTPIVIELNVLPEAPQLVDPQLPGQSFDGITGTITVTALEDLPVEGRIEALDLQGDLLNFTVDTPPAHGTVVINLDGSYTYTPDPDFNGEDSFVIMVDDGKGNLTPATVVVAIGATEDAPHLVDPQIPGQSFDPATGITTVTANEGQPVDGAFGVVDPDGDALAITVDTPPAHGALVINPDGTYSYTPEPGFSGEDSFVV